MVEADLAVGLPPEHYGALRATLTIIVRNATLPCTAARLTCTLHKNIPQIYDATTGSIVNPGLCFYELQVSPKIDSDTLGLAT